MKLIDISMDYWEEMLIYPKNPPYRIKRVQDMKNGDGCNVTELSFGSHTGTHIDAPLHFIADGESIDRLSLDRMNGKAKIVDAQGIRVITVDFLRKFTFEKGDIIVFKTDNSRPENQNKILPDYVTLDYGAAQFLADCGIRMVGIDYLTVERPRSMRMEGISVHQILLGNNILILEGLVLQHVNEGEYELFCLPLKLAGGDGCPVRVAVSDVIKG